MCRRKVTPRININSANNNKRKKNLNFFKNHLKFYLLLQEKKASK